MSNPKPIPVAPIMAQYADLKAEADADRLFAFRMGDFYEFFNEDARTVAKALDIPCLVAELYGAPLPMCAIRVVTSAPKFQAMMKDGHKIAVCEVVGEAKAEIPTEGETLPPRATVNLAPVYEIADFINPKRPPVVQFFTRAKGQ